MLASESSDLSFLGVTPSDFSRVYTYGELRLRNMKLLSLLGVLFGKFLHMVL